MHVQAGAAGELCCIFTKNPGSSTLSDPTGFRKEKPRPFAPTGSRVKGNFARPGVPAALVHRVISRRHTVGFKRVWMRGVREEHIRCDT
jgi:hypothetical protein